MSILENGYMRVEYNARGLKSLKDKRSQREWLYRCAPNNPAEGGFDALWEGGVNVLFPCDMACPSLGPAYGDHGIFWRKERDASFALDFSVDLRGKMLLLEATACNETEHILPYLFRWHPAFALDRPLRLDIPTQDGMCEMDLFYPLPQQASFNWPLLPMRHGDVDLRDTALYLPEQYGMIYLPLEEGKIRLYDEEGGISLRFDEDVFSMLTLFFSMGEWENHRTMVPEPSTGMGYNLRDMLRRGDARFLSPGETARFGLVMELD